MKKILCSVAIFAALSALSREITADEAATAAAAWVDLGYSLDKIAPGRKIASVETLAVPGSGAELRVAAFEGGGFVVLSADDRVDPVIAFSESGDGVDEDDANPFWALLKADITGREEAAGVVRGAGNASKAALAAGSSVSMSSSDDSGVAAARRRWEELLGASEVSKRQVRVVKAVSAVSDIRVDALVKSAWSQSEAGGKNCWNYYTPNNYVCGCTATAIAQVMRYWRWPTSSVARHSYTCSVSGVQSVFTMMGGTYDWNAMPLAPSSSSVPTDAQCRAIGKLLYDVGVTVQMNWGAKGSGASTYAAMYALPDDFGYAGAVPIEYSKDTCQFSLPVFKNHACPCLDAGCPIVMTVPGHAVVLDGYGFSGSVFCIHVNLGWGGNKDAWYCPPDLASAAAQFTSIDGIVANISPTATGNIASGRVLSQSGSPVSGAGVKLKRGTLVVGSAKTDARGIFAIWADPGEYTLVAEKDDLAALGTVSLAETVPLRQVGHSAARYLEPCSLGNSWGNDLTLGTASAPGVPTGVSASDGTSTEAVVVSWNAAAGADSYRVYRNTSADSGLSSCIATGVKGTAFRDAAAVAGTRYFYWVVAENAIGTSDFSADDAGYRRSSMSLNAALDNETLVFTTGGDAAWIGQGDTSHDGTSAAESGAIGNGQSVWLKTTVDGPGTVFFWYSCSCEDFGDFLCFDVDGPESIDDRDDYLESGAIHWITGHGDGLSYRRRPAPLSREGNWLRMAIPVSGSGRHTLRWLYSKDSSLSQGEDRAWVDHVVWSTTAPDVSPLAVSATDGTSDSTVDVSWNFISDATSYSVYRGVSDDTADAVSVVSGIATNFWKDYDASPGVTYRYWVRPANGSGEGEFGVSDIGWRSRPASLSDALDARGLAFKTGGDAVWLPQTDISFDGEDAARSGAVGWLEESWVETSVRGPGTLSFRWRMAPGSTGWADFWVDGVWNSEVPKSGEWILASFEVDDDETHVFKWRFVETSDVAGTGAAWLDQVAWASAKAPEPPAIGPDCSIDPESGVFTITLDVEAGRSYKVQCCENFGELWTTVNEFIPDTSGAVRLEVATPTSWDSSFVRVVTEE